MNEPGSAAGVGGVVLAAGRSRRMGRPKATLPLGTGSFLDAAVAALREGGCAPIVVVVPDRADLVQAALETNAIVALNEDPGSEQIDSLRIGLTALPDEVTAALVLPVDHPLVQSATVRSLAARHRESPEAVIRPVHRGVPGHPTLFPRSSWPLLYEEPLERGARSIVDSAGVPVSDLEVSDPGVNRDIDTPDEYREWAE